MKQSQDNPVIDEIREVHRRISARFDHDPARLVAYYVKLQKQYQNQLVETEKTAERTETSQPPHFVRAIDGSKFLAVNSGHRNFSQAKLQCVLKEVDQKVAASLHALDRTDRQN